MISLFAELPALPLHTAGKYVAGAYIVFVLAILIYVAIMAVRLSASQRDILKLKAELEERAALEQAAAAGPAGPAAATSAPEPELQAPESETLA